MSPPRRRTAVERHVELERMFGTDFLPLKRHKQNPPRPSAPTETARKEQRPEQKPERRKEPTETMPPEFAKFRDEVLACRKCGLCETRTQVVFGVGTLKAPVVFVGEAPGADEDRLGEPFVGSR